MPRKQFEIWQRNLIVCLFGSFTTVAAMTLILPFLPIYIEQLGVTGHAAIVQWSGVAYSASFITAGLVAPWGGYLGDRFGRKSMLLRASAGNTASYWRHSSPSVLFQSVLALMP